MKIAYWLLLIIFMAIKAHAQTDQQYPYQLQELADNLNYPWSLAFLPEGEFLITEKKRPIKARGQAGETDCKYKSQASKLAQCRSGWFA